MRNYESIVIFDPTITEENLKKEISKIETLLQGAGAATINVDIWGRREIAYLVGKHKHGHFVSFSYSGEDTELANKLTAQLRLTEVVIKFQSYRTNLKSRKFKGRPGGKSVGGDWGFDEEGDEAQGAF
ncbi:MAG: 30S ribosomal protein S6 [Oligoflexia bacterium]|nr:30S ribosomal protein S6 [Oligoflexia bacterium]